MKPLLFLAFAISTLLYTGTVSAQCKVPNEATADVRRIIEARGEWPISPEKCQFIRDRKLYLSLTANAQVLVGTSVAWVAVRLIDKNNVMSYVQQYATGIDNQNVSNARAEQMMVELLEIALNNFKYEQAAEEIAQLRTAATSKKPSKN